MYGSPALPLRFWLACFSAAKWAAERTASSWLLAWITFQYDTFGGKTIPGDGVSGSGKETPLPLTTT
jgi:hypothetical protein